MKWGEGGRIRKKGGRNWVEYGENGRKEVGETWWKWGKNG